MRTVTGRCGAMRRSKSTVTRWTVVASPAVATYDSGLIPAYQVAGCTVTRVLPAMAWPLASVTVALMMNPWVPSSGSSCAGTSKRATPASVVRASPLLRSESQPPRAQ